jgi:hypothetical protein
MAGPMLTFASENWTIKRSYKRKISEDKFLLLAGECILVDENEIQIQR